MPDSNPTQPTSSGIEAQSTTNSNPQPEGNTEIPGLMRAQETSNASVGHTEVSARTAVPPSEFRATPSPGKGPFVGESATSNAATTNPRAEIPTQTPDTVNTTTTPTAAPGLEETPKPIDNTNPEPAKTEQPTPEPTNVPSETPTPEAAPPQDTPAQIDASGEVQAPSQNSSEDFAQTPDQPAETDNQAPAQVDQAQKEANAVAAMHIKKAPINLEPEQKLEGQTLSEVAETDNSSTATIEDVNTEAARGFAQIKGTHYEEPFLKGYSEAVAKVLSTKKSE